MARDAIAFGAEDFQAESLPLVQRFRLARHVPVVSRPSREDRAHIRRQSVRERISIRWLAEGRYEKLRVVPVRLQTVDRLSKRQIHLEGVHDRLQHLLFQGRNAPVPEEAASVTPIYQFRNPARTCASVHAHGLGAVVGERPFGIMAGCARDRAVGG